MSDGNLTVVSGSFRRIMGDRAAPNHEPPPWLMTFVVLLIGVQQRTRRDSRAR